MGKKASHVSKPAYYIPALAPVERVTKKVSKKFAKKAAQNSTKQLDNKQRARKGLKVNKASDRFAKKGGKGKNDKRGKSKKNKK